MAKKDIVVILFLAHNGVAQPQLWEYWRDFSIMPSHGEILFFVHAPHNVPEYCEGFVNTYRIRDAYNTPLEFGETGWCETSLVLEFFKSLEAVLQYEKIKSAARCSIYFISGNDIPIKNRIFLFQEELFKKSTTCTVNGAHSQWLSFTKDHAKIIIKHWHDNPYWMTELFWENIVDRKNCPDNSWIYTMRLFGYFGGVKSVINRSDVMNRACITTDTRNNMMSPSPNEWKSWRGRLKCFPYGRISLPTALILARMMTFLNTSPDYSGFFFRKVMPGVVIPQDFLINILWRADFSKKECFDMLNERFQSELGVGTQVKTFDRQQSIVVVGDRRQQELNKQQQVKSQKQQTQTIGRAKQNRERILQNVNKLLKLRDKPMKLTFPSHNYYDFSYFTQDDKNELNKMVGILSARNYNMKSLTDKDIEDIRTLIDRYETNPKFL